MDYLEAWQKFRPLTYDALPEDVKTVASQCVIDWYGCALAGSTEPLAGILRSYFGHRSGRCSVIGSELKLEAPTAALLNGSSGHALDYDDTGSRTGCHSTAPVLPAVLAVAEEIGASGNEMLTAFVVGVEVEGRINHAMGRDHYARGWHTTATLGTFGATAAVAHLLQFDDEQYACAMGLAASHASGVKANFGTMTKPYHPGHAAECGINCARLAEAGFTANPEAVMGNQGFIQAASTAEDRTDVLVSVAGEWLILGTLFKHHAACHLTHSAIEGIQKLKEALDVDDLTSLTITVHPTLLDVCGIPEPRTGLEGKFSLRGTAALVLNDIDTANPETYVDEVISDAGVQGAIQKVVVETDRSLGQFQSRIAWVDKSQKGHEISQDLSEPVTEYKAQGEKLRRKFQSLCDFAGVDRQQCLNQVESLLARKRKESI